MALTSRKKRPLNHAIPHLRDARLIIIATEGTVTLSATTGLQFTGTARPYKTLALNAEYAGGTITAFYGAGTDTNITGSMTSDTDTSGNLLRNYYSWNRTQSTQHFQTVAVRVELPSDFDNWAPANALEIDYMTESTTSTNSLLDVYIYNGDDTPGTGPLARHHHMRHALGAQVHHVAWRAVRLREPHGAERLAVGLRQFHAHKGAMRLGHVQRHLRRCLGRDARLENLSPRLMRGYVKRLLGAASVAAKHEARAHDCKPCTLTGEGVKPSPSQVAATPRL